MRSHISNTGGTAHLRDMIAKAEVRSEARDAAMKSAIVTQLKEGQEALGAMLDRENRTRRAEAFQRSAHIASGAGAVLLLFLVLAFFFANTPPTRWLAMRLVGTTDHFRAGSNMLEGDTDSGFLLVRTQVLLNGQKDFQADYRSCIERVEKASGRFTCKVRLDPVNRSKGRAAS
jgi:hypothetical protein